MTIEHNELKAKRQKRQKEGEGFAAIFLQTNGHKKSDPFEPLDSLYMPNLTRFPVGFSALW
jgi:hypothetical protein